MNNTKIAKKVVSLIRENKHKGEFSSSTLQNLGCYEIVGILKSGKMAECDRLPWLKGSGNPHLSPLSKRNLTDDHVTLILDLAAEIDASPLSKFVRSGEKGSIYKNVIDESINAQQAMMRMNAHAKKTHKPGAFREAMEANLPYSGRLAGPEES